MGFVAIAGPQNKWMEAKAGRAFVRSFEPVASVSAAIGG